MKTCYFCFFCDDDLGECYGFFEKDKGKLHFIHSFSCNDAQYRDEYMSGLFDHFGIEMVPLPDKDYPRAVELMKKEYGF